MITTLVLSISGSARAEGAYHDKDSKCPVNHVKILIT